MHTEAVQLFQVLIQAGATPGEDFSFNAEQQTCEINERAYQLLKQKYPEADWDNVFGVLEADPNQATQAVNNHLGVNFVEDILERIRDRLQELPKYKAAWYIRQILGGVEDRTRISLYTLLSQQLSLSRQAYLECLLHPHMAADPCGEWIEDLVLAAGGLPEDVILDHDEVALSDRGMQLLASVWAGEFDLYAEIAKGQSQST